LATVYRENGSPDQADSIMKRVQEIRGSVVGPLHKGATGPEVTKLQVKLSELGFDVSPDGLFGLPTENALIAFQRSRGLIADGFAGPITLRTLEIEISAETPSLFEKITPEIVSKMFPGAPIGNIKTNLPFVLRALEDEGITDKIMVLMTLATIRAESYNFMPFIELQSSFNTSPGGRPFDLFDNRKDLGNQGPPDGEKFKGRGFLQLTGRANYQKLSDAIGMGNQLIENPDLANQPAIAAKLLVKFLKNKERVIREALLDRNFKLARRLVSGGSSAVDNFTAAFKTGESLLP
jgi:predicted chitinase